MFLKVLKTSCAEIHPALGERLLFTKHCTRLYELVKSDLKS